MELEGRGKKQQGFLAYLLSKLSTNTLSCMSECNTIHEEVVFVIVSNLARFFVDIFSLFARKWNHFHTTFLQSFFFEGQNEPAYGLLFSWKGEGGKRKFIEGHKKVIGYKKTWKNHVWLKLPLVCHFFSSSEFIGKAPYTTTRGMGGWGSRSTCGVIGWSITRPPSPFFCAKG